MAAKAKAKAKVKADDDEDGDEVEAKGKGKKKLIIGVICVALAGGAYMVGSKSAAPPVAGGASTTTTTIELFGGCKKEPDSLHPKMIHDLPEMSINLADGHYLRVQVSLGLCADVVLATPAEFLDAPAQNIISKALTGAKMDVLLTADGRAAATAALTDQIAAEYRAEVYVLYFPEFVMQ